MPHTIIIISFAIRQFQMNPTKPSFDMSIVFALSGEQQQADAPISLTLIVYHLIKQAWPRVTSKTIFVGLQNLSHTPAF